MVSVMTDDDLKEERKMNLKPPPNCPFIEKGSTLFGSKDDTIVLRIPGPNNSINDFFMNDGMSPALKILASCIGERYWGNHLSQIIMQEPSGVDKTAWRELYTEAVDQQQAWAEFGEP